MNLIVFALESPLQNCFFPHGWGNGYVALPKEHPCFGMDYDEIYEKYGIDVSGGLTWASGEMLPGQPKETKGMWVVGFDTAHYGDSMSRWPNEASVLQEAERLKEQLLKIK